MNRTVTILEARSQRFELGSRTWLMGIINVTPDSFSDGGLYWHEEQAVEHGLRLIAEGADIIDVGGESSRPGADPVAEEEERRRVIPVIKKLREKSDVLISVDTMKAGVAGAALAAGADIINDISAFSADPEMIATIKESRASVVIMHMKGTPKTMQADPKYENVTAEISSFLAQKLKQAELAGIPPERIIIDPGIGFGKNVEHNLTLLRELDEFLVLGRPLLLGISRKSFIGAILGLPTGERLEGTIAAAVISVIRGAHILRVHDVEKVKRAVRLTEAVLGSGSQMEGQGLSEAQRRTSHAG